DKPIAIELPASVVLEIVESEPSIRGDTATNVTKKAKCQTGLEIKVPQFIEVGEKVKVDTRTGEFISRSKEKPFSGSRQALGRIIHEEVNAEERRSPRKRREWPFG